MAPIVGRFEIQDGRDGAIAQLGERVVRNDEVGGSIPPGSTSLRSLRELRLGMPREFYRSEVSEGCPAIARRATAGRGKPRSVPLLPRKPWRPFLHKARHAFPEIAAAQRN